MSFGEHVQLEVDDGVAVVTLNRPGRRNAITWDMASDCIELFRELSQRDEVRTIVLTGAGRAFCAGVDLKALEKPAGADVGDDLNNAARDLQGAIEDVPKPVIGMVNGFCLTGGLELALACRYRIACNDSGTRLGFPEVRLGIFPGFGGTVRSTRLLGALPAMNLMLSGRTVSARAAQRLGLVNLAVPERQLRAAALELLAQPPKPRRPAWIQQAASNPLLRPLLAWQMRRKVAQRVNPEQFIRLLG